MLKGVGKFMSGIRRGGNMSGAERLLGSLVDGFAFDTTDDSLAIRDSVTPANNYIGTIAAKLTVTGSLPATSPNGPLWDSSNRAAALLSIIPFSATAGSFYAEASTDVLATLNQTIATFHNGVTDVITLRFINTGIVRLFVQAGGVNQCNIGTRIPAAGTPVPIAAAWAASDFAISVDGLAVETRGTGSIPTVTDSAFGFRGYSVGDILNGRIRKFAYAPKRIPNAQLVAGISSWT